MIIKSRQALSFLREIMNSPRRRPIRKAKTPKDLATQFLEWQKLRAEVSKAERAAAHRPTRIVERSRKKPDNPNGD
jgi:hypothetical protein